jgi:hypothetical protein
MERREERGKASVEIEIPAALADRIDRLFVECRGYEPISLQESLTLLCDLASDRLDPDVPATSSAGATADEATKSAEPAGPAEPAESVRSDESVHSGEHDDRIDEVFPTRWGSDPSVRRRLRAVVDRYLRNPYDFQYDDEREADALSAVANREGVTTEALHDQLVVVLYGNAGLPDDLAGEFFSEALTAVADVASNRTDGGDTGVTFGRSDEPAGDPDDEDAFDVDSLLGAVSQPMADCERCGERHPVNDLDTVIGSKTTTIELLCAECAVDIE